MVSSGGVRVSLLAVIGLVVGAAGFAVLRVAGGPVPTAGWAGVVLLVFMAVGVFFAGLPVRRLREHRPGKPVSALRAARSLALGQAAALTGAGLLGWYAANAAQLLPDLDVDSQQARLWPLVGHAVAATLLVIAGMLTQRHCRLRPDDDDPGGDDRAG